jgi:hypothetical protein
MFTFERSNIKAVFFIQEHLFSYLTIRKCLKDQY